MDAAYRVAVTGYSQATGSGAILYTLQVAEVGIVDNATTGAAPRQWTAPKRFSDFHALHAQLKKVVVPSTTWLPKAPPKKFKLFTAQNEQFLQKRRERLNEYVTALMRSAASKQPAVAAALRDFLGRPGSSLSSSSSSASPAGAVTRAAGAAASSSRSDYGDSNNVDNGHGAVADNTNGSDTPVAGRQASGADDDEFAVQTTSTAAAAAATAAGVTSGEFYRTYSLCPFCIVGHTQQRKQLTWLPAHVKCLGPGDVAAPPAALPPTTGVGGGGGFGMGSAHVTTTTKGVWLCTKCHVHGDIRTL
jgi:hypothetical protein